LKLYSTIKLPIQALVAGSPAASVHQLVAVAQLGSKKRQTA